MDPPPKYPLSNSDIIEVTKRVEGLASSGKAWNKKLEGHAIFLLISLHISDFKPFYINCVFFIEEVEPQNCILW